MAMQAMMKDLRTLKQGEMTLMNLATKISDQLNRLRVEELGLQDLVRNQVWNLTNCMLGNFLKIDYIVVWFLKPWVEELGMQDLVRNQVYDFEF